MEDSGVCTKNPPPHSLKRSALPAVCPYFSTHYTMDHPLEFNSNHSDSYIAEYLTQFSLPPTSLDERPSMRESQTLPNSPDEHPSMQESRTLPSTTSIWSIEADDGHPSTVITTPEQRVGVIRVVESDASIGVGEIIRPEGTRDVVEVKEVICWERHVVLFYGQHQGVQGEEALLVVRNERVRWSWWSTMAWYLFFPFLRGRSSFADSPV